MGSYIPSQCSVSPVETSRRPGDGREVDGEEHACGPGFAARVCNADRCAFVRTRRAHDDDHLARARILEHRLRTQLRRRSARKPARVVRASAGRAARIRRASNGDDGAEGSDRGPAKGERPRAPAVAPRSALEPDRLGRRRGRVGLDEGPGEGGMEGASTQPLVGDGARRCGHRTARARRQLDSRAPKRSWSASIPSGFKRCRLNPASFDRRRASGSP